MATSSMLRSVTIKDKGQCRKLLSALERAEEAKSIRTPLEKRVHDMTPEQIRMVFGKAQK